MIKNYFSAGASLVEVLVASFILSIIALVLMGTYGLYLKTALGNTTRIQGAFLVEEGQEVARFLRDVSWTTNIQSLTPGTNYYPVFDAGTNQWSLTTTPTTVDNLFQRVLTIATVHRDSNSDIVASGGTVDLQTKQVTVTVAAPDYPALATAGTYLINLFNN